MTAQIHEILIFDGKRETMNFCPPLPERHPRVVEMERKIDSEDLSASILYSTACWRGYQGAWMIEGGRFYLVGLRGRYALVGEEPIFADWFSGMLRVSVGDVLEYVHMGFGSVFEGEIHIQVENGLVGSSREISNWDRGHDTLKLKMENFPGGENRFRGDGELF